MAILYCALYIAAIGIASHFIGNALPRRWFHADAFPYKSRTWEKDGAVYRKIGIHHWKDKVPDMSKFRASMVPKAVATHPTAEDLAALIAETCVAECVHGVLIPCSLPVVLLYPGVGGWIVFALCFLGNFPFILIQRYNRPRLLKMQRRLTKTKS